MYPFQTQWSAGRTFAPLHALIKEFLLVSSFDPTTAYLFHLSTYAGMSDILLVSLATHLYLTSRAKADLTVHYAIPRCWNDIHSELFDVSFFPECSNSIQCVSLCFIKLIIYTLSRTPRFSTRKTTEMRRARVNSPVSQRNTEQHVHRTTVINPSPCEHSSWNLKYKCQFNQY